MMFSCFYMIITTFIYLFIELTILHILVLIWILLLVLYLSVRFEKVFIIVSQ